MKKYLLLVFLCLVFVVPPAQSKDENLNIVFIPKSSDQDFWTFMRQGVEEGIREKGNISLTWRGPSYNDDTDAQIKILQEYTRPGIDAIIIAPTDRVRLVDPVRKAATSGIKVIVVDSAIDGNYHRSFITTDNYSAGKLAAKQLSALLGSRGTILIFRTVAGSASTDDRASGFIDQLKKSSPTMTIVADEYGGGSRGKALHSANKILKSIHNIDGLFAVNESASDGMLRALRSAGLAGKVRFIGFDSTPFLLEGLEKKEIDGLIVQNPRQMGYLGIKAAVAAVSEPPVKDSTLFTDTTMVTRENYKKPDIQKLLIP